MSEFAARLLEPTERDAVLGDLIEAGETGWSAPRNVLGLIILRQAELLGTFGPWVAGPGGRIAVLLSADGSLCFGRLHT
jgi:hypothetical protein